MPTYMKHRGGQRGLGLDDRAAQVPGSAPARPRRRFAPSNASNHRVACGGHSCRRDAPIRGADSGRVHGADHGEDASITLASSLPYGQRGWDSRIGLQRSDRSHGHLREGLLQVVKFGSSVTIVPDVRNRVSAVIREAVAERREQGRPAEEECAIRIVRGTVWSPCRTFVQVPVFAWYLLARSPSGGALSKAITSTPVKRSLYAK